MSVSNRSVSRMRRLCGVAGMPSTTEAAVIMLVSHFYESRDGSTGGFFADNVQAGQQVWNTVNTLLRLDRDWKVGS